MGEFNLPPGCTGKMIEDAAGNDYETCTVCGAEFHVENEAFIWYKCGTAVDNDTGEIDQSDLCKLRETLNAQQDTLADEAMWKVEIAEAYSLWTTGYITLTEYQKRMHSLLGLKWKEE